MAHLFFVGYGGGHMVSHIQVIRWLLGHTTHRISVMPLSTGYLNFQRSGLEEQGVECVTFSQYLHQDNQQARELGEALLAEHHRDETGIPREEAIAYLGLNMQDLILEHGEEEAEKKVAHEGRNAFLPYRTMQRVIDDITPDCVIVTSTPRAEQAASRAARNRDIPVVVTPDLFGRVERDRNIKREYGDVLCVLSGESKENYRMVSGMDAQHIFVTGNPAFQPLSELTAQDRKAWRARYVPEWNEETILLWCDQGAYVAHGEGRIIHRDQSDVLETLVMVQECCNAHHIKCVVRPHPSQDKQLFIDWMKTNNQGTMKLLHEGAAEEAIYACDYFGAIASTTLTQAQLLGKSAIKLDYGGEIDPNKRYERMWVPTNMQEFPAKFNAMMSGEHSGGIPFNVPMNPAENVGRVIEALVQAGDDWNAKLNQGLVY